MCKHSESKVFSALRETLKVLVFKVSQKKRGGQRLWLKNFFSCSKKPFCVYSLLLSSVCFVTIAYIYIYTRVRERKLRSIKNRNTNG